MLRALRRSLRPCGGHGNGFTLIEVIVALGILTVGILALIPALLFNIKSNTLSRNRGLANQLAVQKLEDVKSWPIYYEYGTTHRGVASNNTKLFGTETLHIENSPVSFARTTSVFTNEAAANCGTAILFGSSSNGVTRNLDEKPVGNNRVNTTNISSSGCTSGQMRGEDFRIVLVTVTWIDQFGGHSISRTQYIRRG